MAVSMQPKCVVSTRSAVRARCVRVEAVHGSVEKIQVAAASFAAAALLVSPAHAGVVLQQPTLKKTFIDDTPAKVRAPSTPAAPKSAGFSLFGGSSAPAPKAAVAAAQAPRREAPVSDMGLDPRAIALPGAIGFVGGLAFLASKVDGEFDDFMASTLIKDSNVGQSGLGYEVAVKSTYGGIYGEPSATGTKKVKAAKKK